MNLKFNELDKNLQTIIENEIASYHIKNGLGNADYIKFMQEVKQVRLIEVLPIINSYELNRIVNGLCN